jgi:hypothetical protein
MCEIVAITKEASSCYPLRSGSFLAKAIKVDDVDTFVLDETAGTIELTLKVGKTWVDVSANNEMLGFDFVFDEASKYYTHQVVLGRNGQSFAKSHEIHALMGSELIFYGVTNNGEAIVVGGVDYVKLASGTTLTSRLVGLRLTTHLANTGTVKDGGMANTASLTGKVRHPIFIADFTPA